jgi:hypothetical protein
MSSHRQALLAWSTFTSQPLGREINRGTLGQQFALRGTYRTGFHLARRFKGCANLEKLIRFQLYILVRFPHTPVMFQDRAALGHKLGMGGTILGQVRKVSAT